MRKDNSHWRIEIHRDAEKILKRLPKDLLSRIWARIRERENDPRPSDCKNLKGYENLYRIRVGIWRISYAIEEDRLIILILEVAPRGDANRTL